MALPSYWTGFVGKDDISGKPFNGVMYDAKIPGEGWANINQETFDAYGCKLGVGFGQRFELQDDGRWLCTAGSAAHETRKA